MKKVGRLHLFAACAPGLQDLLRDEVQTILGVGARPKAVPGGVAVAGGLSAVMRLNLHSGLANRVLVRLDRFHASKLAELHRKAALMPWQQWLGERSNWQVRATCKRSRLYHSGAVEQRVNDGIAAAVARDESMQPHLVMVRIVANEVVISLDTSGEPLHKRGWRQQVGKAPLREDLARALLVCSGWCATDSASTASPTGPPILVDPMMGAGTILIEAALMAANAAPGGDRSFGFEQLAMHNPGVWKALRNDAQERRKTLAGGLFFGRDRLQGAVDATTGNAERAGVLDALDLEVADLRGTRLPESVGFVVSNPPYGHRIGGEEGAMAALGRRLSELQAGAQVALVATAKKKLRTVPGSGIALTARLMTDHGGTKVVLLSGCKP